MNTPDELVRFNNWRSPRSPIPNRLPKSKHGVAISAQAWEGLENLAYSLGYTYGRSASISAMLEALGQGLLSLEKITTKQTTLQH